MDSSYLEDSVHVRERLIRGLPGLHKDWCGRLALTETAVRMVGGVTYPVGTHYTHHSRCLGDLAAACEAAVAAQGGDGHGP